MDFNKSSLCLEIERLEALRNPTKDDLLCLNNLYKVLNTFYSETYLSYDDVFKRKKSILNIDYIINDINIFNKSSIHYDVIDKLDFYNYSNDDLLSMTNDFYKELGKKYYKLFNDVYHKSNLNCSDSNSTSSIFIDNSFYLSVNKDGTVDDIVSFIHEYGHGISSLINHDHLYDSNKFLYREIDTLFYELIANDYIINNISKRDGLNLANINLADYLEAANNVMKCKKSLLFTSFMQKINKDYIIYKRCYLEDDINIESYLIDYLFAIELHYIYKIDKEKTLYILDNIIKMNNKSSKDYYDEIVKLGLKPNNKVDDYKEGIAYGKI